MFNYLRYLKKIRNIIPYNLSKKFNKIFFILSIGGVFEAMSIALLIPLITLFLNGDVDKIPLISIYVDLKKYEYQELIKIFLTIIFFLYLSKSLYLSFSEYYIQKFSQQVKTELTLKIFKNYTLRPYSETLKNNSSILLRNLTSEIANFNFGVLSPIIMIAKESFIFIFLIVMLFSINLTISILILIFSITFFLFIKRILSNKLKKLGHEEQQIRGQENKIILESLQGIKFIKSYKIENFFNEKLKKILLNFIIIKTKSVTLRFLPRIWIEFILICFVILLSFISFSLGYEIKDFVYFASIFLLSMIKIMPSLISIIKVYNSMQNYSASINLIDKELDIKINDTFKKDSFIDLDKEFKEKIILKNINFKYPNSNKAILENLNFEINKEGQIFGIFGPTGSGKTTLIDILIGILKPDNGQILIDNKQITDISNHKIFGYVPQSTFIFDDTIKNNILLTNDLNESLEKEIREVIKLTELEEFVMAQKNNLDTFIGENGSKISGGQRQRIGIARALISNPKIIILDEATSALDKDTEGKIFKNLKSISKKKSIIIISHNPLIKDFCDKAFQLNDKKLIEVK